MRYRRSDTAGGTYFFTVNLAERKSDVLVRSIDLFREVMGRVKSAHPFAVVAMVVLPEHLHAIWRAAGRRRLSNAVVAHQSRILASFGYKRAHPLQPRE